MSEFVQVPTEALERLRRELPMFVAHDGDLAKAARALVDAAPAAPVEQTCTCGHPAAEHHYVKGGNRWACHWDCACDANPYSIIESAFTPSRPVTDEAEAVAFREQLLRFKEHPDWQGILPQQAIGVLVKTADWLAARQDET